MKGRNASGNYGDVVAYSLVYTDIFALCFVDISKLTHVICLVLD